MFEASEDANAKGFTVIRENLVPDTTGLANFRKLLKLNIAILTF